MKQTYRFELLSSANYALGMVGVLVAMATTVVLGFGSERWILMLAATIGYLVFSSFGAGHENTWEIKADGLLQQHVPKAGTRTKPDLFVPWDDLAAIGPITEKQREGFFLELFSGEQHRFYFKEGAEVRAFLEDLHLYFLTIEESRPYRDTGKEVPEGLVSDEEVDAYRRSEQAEGR
ncbi:MAG: hypothetical protein EOO11_07200 [Chitinophagaceae bacterium]|nr:MAG: hypothetical protein EOO11_07200 [Chitinophagaceae bacterium]